MFKTTWSRYIFWMLGSAAFFIASCGVINFSVDPLGIFGAPKFVGFNAVKPYLDHHRELSRWQAAKRVCGRAGIFGNSRSEIGFDPLHPAFLALGQVAFNHAIPGTGVDTALRQLHWLQAARCAPVTVVLGVEFFDFLGGWPAAALSKPDAAPTITAPVVAETVFSLTALRDAIGTVVIQHTRDAATTTPQGFNPVLNYTAEVARSGHDILFRQRAVENMKRWLKKPKRLRTEAGAASADQLALEEFLGSAAASASTVHLVIYPYHAQIRLMMERAGLGGLFADWKASIVQTAKRLSTDKMVIRVWDFSAISAQTLEAVPVAGDRQTKMQYYWEAGHFKKALGDRMLQQILVGSEGFGELLAPEMLDDWLAEDRRRVNALVQQPSPLLAGVDSLLSRH